MSEQKQIEEMTVEFAKINCNPKGCYCCDLCDEYCSLELSCEDYLVYRKMAETFYNAGYRKQSEVIDEFAEKLKEAHIKCGLPLFGLLTKEEIEEYFNDIMLQVRDAIDNIAKEMKGGEE